VLKVPLNINQVEPTNQPTNPVKKNAARFNPIRQVAALRLTYFVTFSATISYDCVT